MCSLWYLRLYICVVLFCFFFFFKQKTAYEMRISDWSSDVCSSDLFDYSIIKKGNLEVHMELDKRERMLVLDIAISGTVELVCDRCLDTFDYPLETRQQQLVKMSEEVENDRSEEHTSELQSLMRISYAVFCLKKNKQISSQSKNT